MRRFLYPVVLGVWVMLAGWAFAAVLPYSPDADTIGLYHLDSAGSWADATTNQRHLASSPGAVQIATTNLGGAFTNGYLGGTGDVGAVQSTNLNWTMGNSLTVEAWLLAGVSSNAMSPTLFSLRDMPGVVLEFVLRDMNTVTPDGSVLMTPVIRYFEPSLDAKEILDATPFACSLHTGRWYHVAFALDLTQGNHGQVAVYITSQEATAPVLFDTITLSTNLYKGSGAKFWTLAKSKGGGFAFDEFRISSKARAALELETVDIKPSWLSWTRNGSAVVGEATNVVSGSKVYYTTSLVTAAWVTASNGVWSGPSNGVYRFEFGVSNPPGFFGIGR